MVNLYKEINIIFELKIVYNFAIIIKFNNFNQFFIFILALALVFQYFDY